MTQPVRHAPVAVASDNVSMAFGQRFKMPVEVQIARCANALVDVDGLLQPTGKRRSHDRAGMFSRRNEVP